MFYFGCWAEAGHFLHLPSGRQAWGSLVPSDFPLREGVLDGGLLPAKLPQVEGRASLVHFPGWTVLTFWDRSVDARGGCNSSFIMRGHLDFEDAVTKASKAFPSVWSRFKFDVTEWKPTAEPVA